MQCRKLVSGAAAYLCLVVLCAQQSLTAQGAKRAGLYSEQDWKSFASLPEARAPIVFERVDLNLLSAAVFHETNRRRANHRLPAVTFDPTASRAADLQARIMARTGEISHENAGNPEHATLEKRVASVGLKPRFVAENLAYTFAVQYRSGERLYVRELNGQKIFSYQPDGPPLQPHTYISFAKSVVDQWMNSPGHRRNLLSREPTHLGVGCRAGKGDSDLPMVYCCQVFYAPLQAQR